MVDDISFENPIDPDGRYPRGMDVSGENGHMFQDNFYWPQDVLVWPEIHPKCSGKLFD
jgi:hypothetical protein